MTARFVLPPLSLYIHIPWCVRKCSYCDFNSHTATPTLPEVLYIDLLLADLEQELVYAHGRELHSIFFGGGTPSLFSAKALGRLLDGIAARISFSPEIEITLEANPGSAEHGKFTDYRHAGINRLSIGIQSFQEAQLKALGRIHGRQEALAVTKLVRSSGFENFNLDLMYGLPDQSLSAALNDLETAITQAPTHVSWYQLTIEPNTIFWNQPPHLPEDEAIWEIYTQGTALLAAAGYLPYEISAYAQAGSAARHNLNYWQFGDFLGIGAGAHAKTSTPEGQIERRWKTRLPSDYLAQKNLLAGVRSLSVQELPFEFLMNTLRLHSGVSINLFETRTGLAHTALEPARAQAIKQGLLDADPQLLRTTTRGQLFLNDLLQKFL